MKLPRLFGVLLACLLVSLGARATDAQPGDTDRFSPDAAVYVDGLACPFCAYGLEKKMKKLDALRTMAVQLEKGRVLLAFKEGRSLTKEDIQTAVEDAGFTARKIEFPDRDDVGG